MRWNGETEQQWQSRISKPHQRFAIFPTQMDCGAWVWLETYWAREGRKCGWQNTYKSLTKESLAEDFYFIPTTPPPPPKN